MELRIGTLAGGLGALEPRKPAAAKPAGGEAKLAASSAGSGKHQLTLDGQRLEVRIDASLPTNEALARIADYLSQLPPTMRAGVSRFEVRTKDGGDAAATTYSGHRVVFWSGMDYLRPSTFFHEMGHVNAKRVFGHTDPSDAWDRAAAKDGKPITDYAATKPNEDFAEMIEAYWLAKRGDGNHSLAELRTKFPARMKIVEAIVAGEPVDTKDSEYWRVFGHQIPKPGTFWQKIDGPEWVESASRRLSGTTSRLARLNPFA